MPTYPADPFCSSRIGFAALVTKLTGEQTAGLTHGEVERLIEDDGRELLRLLMQDHVHLRAVKEKASIRPMRASDGVLRSERRPTSRALGTLFGDIGVPRLALTKRGAAGGLRPLDAQLNLPTGKYSEGVSRRLAWEVAQVSYDAAVANLRRTTGTTLAKRQAEELVVGLVEDFDAFYLSQPLQKATCDDLVVLSFDGCGVVMRPEALRPETRKRAENSRRRSTAETVAATRDRSARKNRKRMAAVAAVYDLAVVPRSPEDILRELHRTGPHKPRPKAKNKRVWASLEKTVPEVVDDAVLEACRRDEGFQRRWVALIDGNAEQIRWIGATARDYGVEVTLVVDFIHVLGYLWKAGKALEGNDPKTIEGWVAKRSLRLLQGRASGVAAGIRRAATARGLTGSAREAVDDCARYLLNHKAYLRYHEYLRDGLPIASGVIEGACRSLVKDRMDITGARWGLRGEAVLKLRALRASGDLDKYIDFQAGRELHRNHLDRFDASELSELRAAA